MRRVVASVLLRRRPCSSVAASAAATTWRFSSYVAGLFHGKVIADELVPYPQHKLDSDVADNVQTLIEQIRGRDGREVNTAGAVIAAEYGGLGLSHTAHALLCEELGTVGDVRALHHLQHCGLASRFIASFGSREVKGRYLTAMSDGSVVMAWALREACGCDASMNTTTAERRDDGVYYITGQKRCVFAASATHFLVQAKTQTQVATTDGAAVTAQRSTFFIVAKATAGVRVDADEASDDDNSATTTTTTTTSSSTVTFADARAEEVVGVVGEGYKAGMTTLLSAQHVYAAVLLGTLKRAVQELRDTVEEQWAVDMVASCACTVYAMESTLYALTANYDVPVDDSFLETALAVAFVQTSVSDWLASLATATPPTPSLARCMTSARLLLSTMESPDFLYAAAVCCGVEDYGLYFQRASTLQMMQLRMARSLGAMERLPLKDVDCTLIDKATVKFAAAVEATFVRHTSNVVHQQLLLNRLGEAAALLYAATATAARAALCQHKRLRTAKTERQLASAFVTAATQRASVLCDECRYVGLTSDDLHKRIALALCEDALAPHSSSSNSN